MSVISPELVVTPDDIVTTDTKNMTPVKVTWTSTVVPFVTVTILTAFEQSNRTFQNVKNVIVHFRTPPFSSGTRVVKFYSFCSGFGGKN